MIEILDVKDAEPKRNWTSHRSLHWQLTTR